MPSNSGGLCVWGGILAEPIPQLQMWCCEMETSHFLFPLFPLKPMFFLSPSPTKVIIITASGREPVTRHYCKVESLPDCQLLGWHSTNQMWKERFTILLLSMHMTTEVEVDYKHASK